MTHDYNLKLITYSFFVLKTQTAAVDYDYGLRYTVYGIRHTVRYQ